MARENSAGTSLDPATRYALIVLDGLADRPHPDFAGRTPLEAAETPHLDALAGAGQLGDVIVIGPGIAPESDAGVFALLGYDPVVDSPGRGVLEALGLEVPLEPGDVALRMNFATFDGEHRVLDPRVGRSLTTSEASALAEGLTAARLLDDDGIDVTVRASVGHRGVVVLHPRRGALSAEISNADPFYERVGGMGHARSSPDRRLRPVMPLDHSPEAARTAAAVNRWIDRALGVLAGAPVNGRRALAGRPIANGLLLRNAGQIGRARPTAFAERHGRTGAAITEMPVERGIARWLGLSDQYVGPMGPDRDAGYRARAQKTIDALATAPFVYVHLKGPDEPGHDGNPARKREIIESIDRSFFGPLREGLAFDRIRIAVTADHATPCVVKGHSDDPVPLLVTGAGVTPAERPARPVKFGEAAARAGALGRRTGAQVVATLWQAAVP